MLYWLFKIVHFNMLENLGKQNVYCKRHIVKDCERQYAYKLLRGHLLCYTVGTQLLLSMYNTVRQIYDCINEQVNVWKMFSVRH